MGNHTNRGQVHNDVNELLEDSEYVFEYTPNGQLSRKTSKLTGEKTEYEWNVEGKLALTRVKRADNTLKSVVINRYDALERRITREVNGLVTKYFYDNEDIIVEYGPNNSIQALYLHGPGIDEPVAMARDVNKNGSFERNELFFYSKDHLNSVHDLTDFEGRPIQRYNYSAYGKTKLEKTDPDLSRKFVMSPYGYTSREWEQETGDYYYRDRTYNPSTGKFLSEDLSGFKSLDFNLYNYVKNNPVLTSDPSGRGPVSGITCEAAVYASQFAMGIAEYKSYQMQANAMDGYIQSLTRNLSRLNNEPTCLKNLNEISTLEANIALAKIKKAEYESKGSSALLSMLELNESWALFCGALALLPIP